MNISSHVGETINKSPTTLPDSVVLEHLNEAIQLLPQNEKEAYLEALNQAPYLIQKESNPLKFLRHENFNLWATSQRLVSYWKMRKEIFGPEAFLKPMHQTGSGALSAIDIEILDTGYIRLLPKSAFMGQCVVWWDREILTPDQLQHRTARLRVFFYIMQLVIEDCGNSDENEEVSTLSDSNKKEDNECRSGLTIVANLSATLAINSDYGFSSIVTGMMQEAFPLHIDSIHLVTIPGNLASTILTTLIGVVLRMVGAYFSRVTYVHVGSNIRELQQKLRTAGFDKKFLPQKIGGLWKDEKLEQFKRRRCKIEAEMFLSEDEKLDMKRKVNMIHSRQKRERRKIELEVIQEQAQTLKDQNDDLRADNERLEKLIEIAQIEAQISEQATGATGILQSCRERLDSTMQMDITMQGNQQSLGRSFGMSECQRSASMEMNHSEFQGNARRQQLFSHSNLSAHSVNRVFQTPVGNIQHSFRSDSLNISMDLSNNNFLQALATVRQIHGTGSLPARATPSVLSFNPDVLRPDEASMMLNYNPGLLQRFGNIVPDVVNGGARNEVSSESSGDMGLDVSGTTFYEWQR